jgi:hypothetical protein
MMVPTTNLYKIDAIFKTHGHEIDFPIVAGTSCNPSDITAYVKDNIDIAISLELAQEWSCGSCLAKRVFVSQYSKEAPSSAYYGTGWATLLQSPHQDTLTKMFAKCVEENACTPAYLKDTSQGKNMLEQALAILEKVGLGESFKKKKVYFSRFVKQDKLANEVRPGIELLEPYLEDKLDKITLKNLMDTPPDQYKKTIEFNLDELTNQDNIYRKILYSTTIEDHWIKLMVLLNQKDIEKLLAQYIILNENPEEKINNFATNLVAALKTFYAKSYDSNWHHARPYPINENNLRSDLARLKRNVLANASWKIKEETPSSQQMTHAEGGNQQLSLERK